jgi:hypothetical protein
MTRAPSKSASNSMTIPASPAPTFGPEAYATDDQGGTPSIPKQLHIMQGTGQWVRRSWTIPAVSLQGVNAGPSHRRPAIHHRRRARLRLPRPTRRPPHRRSSPRRPRPTRRLLSRSQHLHRHLRPIRRIRPRPGPPRRARRRHQRRRSGNDHRGSRPVHRPTPGRPRRPRRRHPGPSINTSTSPSSTRPSAPARNRPHTSRSASPTTTTPPSSAPPSDPRPTHRTQRPRNVRLLP